MDSHPVGRRGPKPNPDTRSNLVRAGVRAMHAQGYAATGVQSILEEAHVPKGTFYNHFESKEAFGAEVLDAYSQSGQDKLRVFLGNRDIAPLARLEAYFDDRIEAFRASDFNRGCLLGNFSAEAADHSAVIRQHLQKHFAGWSDIFETCIADAQAEGAVDKAFPADVLARFIFNSWEGALLRMRAMKTDAPLLEFKRIVFTLLLRPCG